VRNVDKLSSPIPIAIGVMERDLKDVAIGLVPSMQNKIKNAMHTESKREHELDSMALMNGCEDYSAELDGQGAEDDECGIQSVDLYAADGFKRLAFALGVLCTGGLLLLFVHWFPAWWATKLNKRVANAIEADIAVIMDTHGSRSVAKIRGNDGRTFIEHRFVRYFLRSHGAWTPATFKASQPLRNLIDSSKRGLTDDEVAQRRKLFGSNLADVPVTPAVWLLVDEGIIVHMLLYVFVTLDI
jgi:hypothetical protein